MNEIRKVKVDHNSPANWASLTADQKQRHNIIANYVLAYCDQNRNEYLMWDSIDRQIPHIYSWVFNAYNASHQNSQVIYDEVGVKIVDRETNICESIGSNVSCAK